MVFSLKAIFWLSIAMVFYAYIGYPMCLWLISIFKRHHSIKPDEQLGMFSPFVSLIITAHNEEKRIREKIENSLAQGYPQENLEIIVASDYSTDLTDDIVKNYKKQGVKLVRTSERKGKENAQKTAIQASKGEILVFSDVGTILDFNGITNIVANFADPSIGCVSSEDKFIDLDGKLSGEGAYVKYEMFLRKLETRINTVVGLSGSFFAARREVCINWNVDLQSDFNTLLNSVRSGLRGISDPDSIGYYKNIVDVKKEFDRKVRTVLRGITVLMSNFKMLDLSQYGLFSWQFLSHKLCRWSVPFFLILSFFSNLILIYSAKLYVAAFILQLGFYGMALLGLTVKGRNILFFKIPYFFVNVNISILVAWFKYFKGERITYWQPSNR